MEIVQKTEEWNRLKTEMGASVAAAVAAALSSEEGGERNADRAAILGAQGEKERLRALSTLTMHCRPDYVAGISGVYNMGAAGASNGSAASPPVASLSQDIDPSMASYCYSVEIQRKVGPPRTTAGARVQHSALSRTRLWRKPQHTRPKPTLQKNVFNQFLGFRARETDTSMAMREPVHYCLVIHSPIKLENLLPSHRPLRNYPHYGGRARRISEALRRAWSRERYGEPRARKKPTANVLWSGYIESGAVRAIHSISLELPLSLRITLPYCSSVDPHVTIHVPLRGGEGETFMGSMQRAVDGYLGHGSA